MVGGGEIRGTPALLLRKLAMYGDTFLPGSCPPSPGLAPCATLISSCAAPIRNAVVTPNLPEATCRIAEVAMSPFRKPLRWGNVLLFPSASASSMGMLRCGSSPPECKKINVSLAYRDVLDKQSEVIVPSGASMGNQGGGMWKWEILTFARV